jgi:hypothetical protein
MNLARFALHGVITGICLLGTSITLANTHMAPALRNAPTANAPAKIVKPAALKPNIVVTGASAAIQKNCQGPKPALVATVTLRNNGGATLVASQGTVYVSEDNGSPDRLVSNGIHLPAFGPGETKTVNIPVISLSPYSKLAGSHLLTVHLLPLLANNQYSFPKPATDHRFTVSFPVGFCQGK